MSPRVDRPSALHAARATVAAAYCLVLATVALSFEHPVALAAVAVAILGGAAAAGAGRALARAALFAVPLALLIALVNPLVAREGLTVLARLGSVPPFGQLDLTLEALTYGAILGVRALLSILACALLAACVDPDELLRAFRRVSLRSALTAALAIRLVPVLARDARRLAAAQRCRPGAPLRPPAGDRVALVRAVATNALDRAVDVAATLEVRGYAGAARPARVRPPWSRHDIAVAAAAAGLAALTVGAHLGGLARFDAYPSTSAPTGTGELLLGLALVAVALAPFADRRGIER